LIFSALQAAGASPELECCARGGFVSFFLFSSFLQFAKY